MTDTVYQDGYDENGNPKSVPQGFSGYASHVAIKSGGVFIPTNFAAAYTANGSAGAVQYDTMTAGATVYKVVNKELAAGDALRIAWGATQTEAGNNIAAGAGEVILPASTDEFTIPVAARDGGKMAYISDDTAAVDFQGSQGA